MLQKWKELTLRKQYILLGTVIVVLLLAIYVWAAARPGYWAGEFFLYQTPDGWQGRVYGEEVTVEKTAGSNGTVLQLQCSSGETVYEVSGTVGFGETVTVRQDGKEIFRGSYDDGHLFENGDTFFVDLRISVAMGAGTYILDENNNQRLATGLDLRLTEIVELALGVGQGTRGYPLVSFAAAFLLGIVFVELWSPETMFRYSVGRYIQGDAEPSDWYEAHRIIGIIVTIGASIIILIMGFSI